MTFGKQKCTKNNDPIWWIMHRQLGYNLAFKHPNADLESINAYDQTKVIEYKAYLELKESEQKLQSEINNLKAIIAKELSENDEFGKEFVITTILNDKIEKLLEVIKIQREALEFYSLNNENQMIDVCTWQGEGVGAGWTIIDDGEKARQALAKAKELENELR